LSCSSCNRVLTINEDERTLNNMTLTHGIYFLLFTTTLVISILVVVLSLVNREKKVEVEPNEAEKSLERLKYKN